MLIGNFIFKQLILRCLGKQWWGKKEIWEKQMISDRQECRSDARNAESISTCLAPSLCVSTHELNAMWLLTDPHLWEREDLAQCKLCCCWLHSLLNLQPLICYFAFHTVILKPTRNNLCCSLQYLLVSDLKWILMQENKLPRCWLLPQGLECMRSPMQPSKVNCRFCHRLAFPR